MIGLLIKRYRQRSENRRRNAESLYAYRVYVDSYLKWFASEPDVCAVLSNMKAIADGGKHDRPRGNAELRDEVRVLRRAQFLAAQEKALRDALMHLRLLVREVDGVDASWADERRRCTLSGGSVTIGELRAAKRFIDRIDRERIEAHEAATRAAEEVA